MPDSSGFLHTLPKDGILESGINDPNVFFPKGQYGKEFWGYHLTFLEKNPVYFEEIKETPKMIKGWAHPDPIAFGKRDFVTQKPINDAFEECFLIFEKDVKGWFTEEDMKEFAEAVYLLMGRCRGKLDTIIELQLKQYKEKNK